MDKDVLILLGTLGGFIVGGLFGLLGSWLREAYESKRRKRELYIKAAIEDWTKQIEVYKGRNKRLMPLDAYIAHHTLILESLLSKKGNPEILRKKLEESHEIDKVFLEYDERIKREERGDKLD